MCLLSIVIEDVSCQPRSALLDYEKRTARAVAHALASISLRRSTAERRFSAELTPTSPSARAASMAGCGAPSVNAAASSAADRAPGTDRCSGRCKAGTALRSNAS